MSNFQVPVIDSRTAIDGFALVGCATLTNQAGV